MTVPFVVYDQTGKITRTGVATNWEAQAVDPGEQVIQGTADPDLDRVVNGSVVAKAQADLDAMQQIAFRHGIMKERKRRIQAGVLYNGKIYDFDQESKDNIDGAHGDALAAIVDGAVAGDLRWFDPSSDFYWITQDNSLVPLDAFEMRALGKAGAMHVRDHVFAAAALKAMDPIPANYTDDQYWP